MNRYQRYLKKLDQKKGKSESKKESSADEPTPSTSKAFNDAPQEVHPFNKPIINNLQSFLYIRKKIAEKRRGIYAVKPKPPHGFDNYLMNRRTYILTNNTNIEPRVVFPKTLEDAMQDLFIEQERERHKLKLQHIVQKEKLVITFEQEILRTHGRAAMALLNQYLPFSACTFLLDEDVYNFTTPEQEEKFKNSRLRYNGRLFISWLNGLDDKWEKIKETMLITQRHEAESLFAIQNLNWEWKMKEVGLCHHRKTPNPEDVHVSMVRVSDDFDHHEP